MKFSVFLRQAGDYPAQAAKPCRRFTRLRWVYTLGGQTIPANTNQFPLSKIPKIKRSVRKVPGGAASMAQLAHQVNKFATSLSSSKKHLL
jgi:hypothetical protein